MQRNAAAAAAAAAAGPSPAALPPPGAPLFPSLPPVCLDIDELEEGDGGGAAPAATTGAAEPGTSGGDDAPALDADGNPPSVHLPALARLFAHITAAVSRHARVWQLYAAVEDASGRPVEADDCRLRCVRRWVGRPLRAALRVASALA